MKDIIVMCPTVFAATEAFKRFCNKNNHYIEKASKFQRRITLIDGTNVFFKGETEGQRGLIGTRANIVRIDEFPMEV